jgi:hypothetical protein
VTNQGISCVRHKQHVRLRPDDDLEAFPEHGMIFDIEDAYRSARQSTDILSLPEIVGLRPMNPAFDHFANALIGG